MLCCAGFVAALISCCCGAGTVPPVESIGRQAASATRRHHVPVEPLIYCVL